MTIYAIVCSETLKIYIGQHNDVRPLGDYLNVKWSAAHLSSNRSRLYAAMRKYPRESWSIHPLISDIQEEKELDELEKHYIRVLKVQHSEVGYNICDGGQSRGKGPWNKGLCGVVKQSPETIEKRRAKNIGQTRTPEQAARIAAARKGKGLGDRNANHRNGLSDEHKARIGKANASTWTPERRQRQAEQLKRNLGGEV